MPENKISFIRLCTALSISLCIWTCRLFDSGSDLVLSPPEVLGLPGFSDGMPFSVSLSLDDKDQPYAAFILAKSGMQHLAFRDLGNNGKLAIMRWNGSDWNSFGVPDSAPGKATLLSLALSSSGVPYLAYKDGGNGNKVTVIKASMDP